MQIKVLAAAAAALLVTGTASAQTYNGVSFAGGAAGDGVSGYAGVVYALPGAQLGRGLAGRGSANAGTYDYNANGQRIEGKFIGGEIALVYQLSGAWGWANFSAGPRITNTSLSPDDPANDREGTRVDLGVQTDGGYWIDRSWRLDWIGSVGVRDGAYFGRAGLGRLVDRERGTRLGLEAGVQGDPRYQSTSAGVFAATKLSRDLEVRLSAGATDQEDRKAKAYATVGLSLLL